MDAGFKVQAFQRKGETFDALKKGLTIESEDRSSSRRYKLLALSSDVRELKPSKLIIVLVKSFSTEEVAPVKAILEEDGVILTLQNGLGNAEILSSIFGEEKTGVGVAHYGAIKRSPGVVQEAGGASIVIGPWKKGVSMEWVADVLEKACFNVAYVDDPRIFIWKKLIVNSMVNTTAALTGLDNEGLLASPLLVKLMKEIGEEAVEAARRAGFVIDLDELWPILLDNIRKTATNIPSMLQDNLAGRKMEVDSIPGGVLQYAGDDSDFPCTRTLYALLKAIDTSRGFD